MTAYAWVTPQLAWAACGNNTFWSAFESSTVMPSYGPLTCPSGYLMVRWP